MVSRIRNCSSKYHWCHSFPCLPVPALCHIAMLFFLVYANISSAHFTLEFVWTNYQRSGYTKKNLWRRNDASSDDTFLPEASFGLRVLSLPVSVCVCVCVCINHLLVRTITRHLFKLGSPNLVQRSKTPWLSSLLFWGAIDLDLQGQI